MPTPILVPDEKNMMGAPVSVHLQDEALIAPIMHNSAQTGVSASLPIPDQSGSYARVSVSSPILTDSGKLPLLSSFQSVAASESVSVVSVETVSKALETKVLPCAE